MKPKISVVIPAYNNERTLMETLSSLRNQTFKEFEIIVVDDCSKDGTYEVAKKFTKNIIKNKTNLGPAKSRNRGIKKARAEIIAFTDSDCVVDENWLKGIYNVFRNKKISVMMGNVKIPKSNLIGDSISALGFPAGGSIGFDKIWHVSKEGFTNHISSCNFAARKSIFEKYGLFDESFPLAGGEDSEFSHRLTKKGVKIRYCPEVLVFHEPTTSFISFLRWQIKRGKSNYHFKKKVENVDSYIRLRIWSTKNILRRYYKDRKFPLIASLLILSFIFQQIGYLIELFRSKNQR